MSRFYLIGETVYDIVFKNSAVSAALPGGSLLNTAVSLGRLNGEVYYMSEIGGDSLGQNVKEFLLQNNISTPYLSVYPSQKTSIAIASLDESNNATYTFYKNYAPQRQDYKIPEFQETDFLLFGSSYAINPDIRSQLVKIVEQAKAKGAFVVYDPNFRSFSEENEALQRQYMLENVRLADIVKGSDEDFEKAFGISNEAGLKMFRRENDVSLLVRTLGRGGAEAWAGNVYAKTEAEEVEVKSTIGAGDTFSAGLVYGLSKEEKDNLFFSGLDACKLKQILDIAGYMASHVCGSFENYVEKDFADRITR